MSTAHLRQTASTMTVFDFLDPAAFLEELYLRAKADRKDYSYLKFAKELGLPETNMVRLFIRGARLLSEASARTICGALGFERGARAYFVGMVVARASRSPERREQARRRLLELQKERVDAGLDSERIEFFESWINPVVREILRIDAAARTEAEGIAALSAVPLTRAQVEKALSILLRLGLANDANGKINASPEQVFLPTDPPSGKLSLIEFHRQQLELSKEALVRVPEEERQFHALTLCVSEESFRKIEVRLVEFCQQVMERETLSQERTVVVQFNTQFFRLARKQGVLP